MKNILSITFLASITALLVVSCQSGKNDTGRIFMPDMTYSNAYEAYSSTKFQHQSDTDAISALKPIEGSIPRGFLPNSEEARNDKAMMMSYLFKNYFKNPLEFRNLDDNEQRALASQLLANPYKRTDDVMTEGARLYTVNCAVCHGPEGKGLGSIVVDENGNDGPYTAIPPSYESRLPGLSDGEIYYSISYGKNMMGGYFSQIDAQDRWKLVHYIKDMAGMEDDYSPVEINVQDIEVATGSEIDIPNIYYNLGSAQLRGESYYILDQLVDFFKSNENVTVEIGAHADARGDFDNNMILSSKRANSVVNYLISKGISESQLLAKGYGSTDFAVECEECTEAEHQQNRRTTFKILEVN